MTVFPTEEKVNNTPNFIERNLFTIFLFVLAVTALLMYGYNQNTEMKEVALVLIGGFVVHARDKVKEIA